MLSNIKSGTKLESGKLYKLLEYAYDQKIHLFSNEKFRYKDNICILNIGQVFIFLKYTNKNLQNENDKDSYVIKILFENKIAFAEIMDSDKFIEII